jgi:hypothetical protein
METNIVETNINAFLLYCTIGASSRSITLIPKEQLDLIIVPTMHVGVL